MVLSDDGIRKAISKGALEISPTPDADQYNTSAVDLFLGDQFSIWNQHLLDVPGFQAYLDLSRLDFGKTASAYLVPLEKEKDGSVIFPPYRDKPWHILAITRERIHLKRDSLLAARVEGRSSLARIGLVIHLTAPTIHGGWNGKITLEMINFSPFYLRLVPGRTRVCQLIVERLESNPSFDITTTFQGQNKPSGEK
jgi:dCTP deaminase